MKPNERRHFSGNTVAEVATHRITHHFAQFLNGFTLRGNRVSQSGGNITAVRFIFLNFKNDFAHRKTLFRPAMSRKPGTV